MIARPPTHACRLLAGLLAAGPATASDFDLLAAIDAAPTGATVTVPAGTYAGPLVIEKSMTLAADGRVVLDGGGEGDVIQIKAPDVTIRGFVIRHTGDSLDRENAGVTVLAPRATIEHNVLEDVLFGIYVKAGVDSVIRGNTIGGKDLAVQRRGDGIRIWQSHRTLIEDNVVRHSRDAVMWFSDGVHLRNNRIIDGRYGLHFMYSDGNIIEDNHLEGNSVGAFLMYSKGLTLRRNVFARNRGPSGFGVGLKDMDSTVAEDNLFLGNRVGLHLDSSPSSMRVTDTFTRNIFAFNDIGIAFLPAVQRNRFQVEGRGNFWSDYRGYDLDGDGLGDLAYRSESLFENLMDREPKLRLFLFSPAQQAVEMAAKAFPMVMPQPKFSDEAPLMAPVAATVAPAPPQAAWPMAVLAVSLLAGAGITLAGGRWHVPHPAPVSARGAGP
jgi:nitrous oxidase accessory protein